MKVFLLQCGSQPWELNPMGRYSRMCVLGFIIFFLSKIERKKIGRNWKWKGKNEYLWNFLPMASMQPHPQPHCLWFPVEFLLLCPFLVDHFCRSLWLSPLWPPSQFPRLGGIQFSSFSSSICRILGISLNPSWPGNDLHILGILWQFLLLGAAWSQLLSRMNEGDHTWRDLGNPFWWQIFGISEWSGFFGVLHPSKKPSWFYRGLNLGALCSDSPVPLQLFPLKKKKKAGKSKGGQVSFLFLFFFLFISSHLSKKFLPQIGCLVSLFQKREVSSKLLAD